MSNPLKKIEPKTEQEAFEMIELAINEIETLAQAFNLIDDLVGGEEEYSDTPHEEYIPERWLN